MSDFRGQNPSTERRKPSQKVNGVSLTRWIYQSVGINQGRVSSRLRGNNLHILIESSPCPDAASIIPKLTQALQAVPLGRLLPAGSPPIYRVIAYGRQSAQVKPDWTESFYLNQPPSVKPGKAKAPSNAAASEPSPPTLVSLVDLARGGHPDAIARYLSRAFSELGVAVRARVEVIGKVARESGEGEEESGTGGHGDAERWEHGDTGTREHGDTGTREHGDTERHPTPHTPHPIPKTQNSKLKTQNPKLPLKRLYIVCESAYSPDPLILAEPLSQHLRELELQGFRDAVVFGQVSGEPKPEWLLRIDLTPATEILQEWGRWGDVQAIAHLLNRILLPQHIRVSALLKDSTLHLTCEGTQAIAPDKLTAVSAITPTLTSLSPQGIRAVTVYGVSEAGAGEEDAESEVESSELRVESSELNSPTQNSKLKTQNSKLLTLNSPPSSLQWVHWLNLPAVDHPELARTPLELAHAANLGAIAFLLTRLLNPSLQRMLATGGVRVQVRQKGDLLHIMTDAPTCPNQGQVGAAISRFLKPVQVPGIAGVRVYGRRSGQKQPLWSYGVDFESRDRLVPEATPEFAASDAYVHDLIEPPGAIVLWSELPPNDLRSIVSRWLERLLQKVQRSLVQTQLFIPIDSADLNPDLPVQPVDKPTSHQGTRLAFIWSAVGLLLVVQADWLLGQMLQPPAPRSIATTPSTSPPPSPSPSTLSAPTPLPKVSLKKTPAADSSAFNSSGFTEPGQVITEPSPNKSADAAPAALSASPLQPQAGLSNSAFPTFNSRQLDERIALYDRYVTANGVPDVLIVGSSRALRGVDPVALQKLLAAQGYSGVKAFNFGINGATAQVVDLLLRQMLPQEKMPKLILFADGARAFNSGRLDITYNGIIASEGYRLLVAGKPPIAGTPVARLPKPANANPSEPTSVTEEPSASLANGYQSINQELNKRLGALSQLYTRRDRLKVLLSEQFAVLLPGSNSFLAFKKMSPGELSEATSPAASASNSPPSVLTEGGVVDVDGFLPLSNRFNPVTYYQKYARVLGDYDSDYESFSMEGRQTEAMIAIAQFAQSRQIPLVFVNLPLTNDYLDPIRKQHEEEFQQQMLQLSTQLGFTYRDLSPVLATQPEYFSDPSHLNRYGAYDVSRRLAEDVLIPWAKTR